ncbi:MAG: hypothetical protein B7C55_13355 [Actinomycetales bacterium mxb001]|nr:MAG: hypothetical protein B7C55_13355 [Actinomycetales bacterium mxb001]
MAVAETDVAVMTRRLLLVEDDPFSRGLLAQTFSTAGFNVLTAADAIEAVRLFEMADPDAPVVDIKLATGHDRLEPANAPG